MPDAGRRTLASVDPGDLLTSEPTCAARRGISPARCDDPLADLPPDDDGLLALVVRELVERAARGRPDVSADRLEHALLVLQRNRLDREVRRAQVTGSGDVGRLAREREQVMGRVRDVVARLEGTI